MHRNKKKRNIIIFSLVGVLLCMVAGYAAFQTQLEIKGTSKVTSNWNILITNVTEGTPTGSAENAVKPSWKNTSASMEANLYDKGDAMEYDVTIENQGTIDAKLNDILTNLQNSNSDAVLITFSGYAKGEILKAGESKLIHVKIEYNPEYEGGETSSEVTIDFDYGQNNNEENNPDDQYLLTYDYSTNGGQSVELDKEYMISGSNVNLDNTATKEGWAFVGWNTDKDAQIGLKEFQMSKENTTLYAIYSKDLKVTYEKEDTVESIGKNEDACTIYNNEASCEVTLPEINVNDESATVGWYESNNKVGNPGDKYTLKNDITLIAKAEFEPIIQSWLSGASTDFHAEEYRANIITATFLDNKEVPDNAIASWDVSANKNGSVMAWVVADESDSTKYHLYIGGEDGVIANQNSSYLFQNFTALTEITFGDNFDTSNVTGMGYMFSGCSKLTSLDVSKWDTGKVTSMYRMFYNCSSLTTLDVSNWDTSNVTSMGYMFTNCSSLTTLDVSKWDTSNVTNMSNMFTNCSSLTTLDVNNWNTSNVTNMASMFLSCSSLTTLDVSNWNTSNVTSMYQMFYRCSSLTTLNVNNWNTSSVTNMSQMFYRCSSLTTLDVSKWNTSKVTDMRSTFYGCSKLTTLDISKWDTGNVTNMQSMFYNCSSLTTLDVSNFDTSNVTVMTSMFNDCSGLITLDLSNWNTSNVTEMSNMFLGCSSLTGLDVSNWNTSNVTSMYQMFYNCSSLTKLKLCSFDTNKVTDMEYMFRGTSNLNSIYVGPNWTTENATTTNMFYNSGVSEVTQSDNCEVDAEDISLSVSTTSTTNSITVVANATADSGIAKYEYSKDNGETWIDGGTNNTYTFTGLKPKNAAETLKETVVTSGDGLYADEYESGKYTYKGANPNNYITFNNETWRIISIGTDNTIKIMRNKSIGNIVFDSGGSNDWATSDIKSYLDDTYFPTIATNTDKIVSHTWSIGGVTDNNSDLAAQVKSENGTKSTSTNIGMITASEYLRANSNKSQCGNMSLNNTNATTCLTTNWMYNILPSGIPNLWTISPRASYSDNVFRVTGIGINGGVTIAIVDGSTGGVAPVLYLTSDIALSGSGTSSDPYQIGTETMYPIKVKVTSNINKQITSETYNTALKNIQTPTFKETETSNGKTVTINYPKECGSSLTCTYQKDNGTAVNVTSTTVNVSFTESGSLVATVTDGTNTVSSSYTVTVLPYNPGEATDVITDLVSTKPDELYTDDNDNIRYYGVEPNNYVYYNCTNVNNQTSDTCELWRIMGIIDGKVKIIKDEALTPVTTDNGVTIGTSSGFYWNRVQQSGKNRNNWEDSTLQTYLNGTYYNSLNSTYKNMISEETYYLGGATSSNYKTLTASGYYNAERDSSQVYSGNPASTTQHIGLMYPSDYGYAAGSSCLSTTLYNYDSSCKNSDYLFSGRYEWLQAPIASSSYFAANLGSTGRVSGYLYDVLSNSFAVRPVLYLNTNVQITDGIGSQSNPFKLLSDGQF